MKKLLKPWLVAVALAAAGITQALAGTFVIGTMTVNPDEGFAGVTDVTVSGEGCGFQLGGISTFAGGDFQVSLSMSGGPEAQNFDLGDAPADEGGNWTHTFTVPAEAVPSAEEGDYSIDGTCEFVGVESTSGLSLFAGNVAGAYEPHPFTVLAQEEEPPPDEPEEEVEDTGTEAPTPVEVQPAFTG